MDKVWDKEAIQRLENTLTNPNLPMAKRNRAAFTLRNINTVEAIDALRSSMSDESVLLAHEVCYIMGQMQNEHAVPYLLETLKNENLHPMVRHEAAEALGALGGEKAEEGLRQFKDHHIPEIKDTCVIALDLLDWKRKNKDNVNANANHPVYMSVDPAPPEDESKVSKLSEQLLNSELSLFQRYKALFALRNIANTQAIEALGKALLDKNSGAVFTHEVAYVLGQIQDKAAIEVLTRALEDESLNCMVRHEAAEALGSIADEKTVQLIQKYSNDPVKPVSESCMVALDILDYHNSDEFHYANNDEEDH